MLVWLGYSTWILGKRAVNISVVKKAGAYLDPEEYAAVLAQSEPDDVSAG